MSVNLSAKEIKSRVKIIARGKTYGSYDKFTRRCRTVFLKNGDNIEREVLKATLLEGYRTGQAFTRASRQNTCFEPF